VTRYADIYLLADFHKWRQKAKISDKTLCAIAQEIAQGLIDANLGGGVVKKRIGLGARGKRGGARAIIGVKAEERIFFLYSYTKNAQENITDKEKKAFQLTAKALFDFSRKRLSESVDEGALFLVTCEGVHPDGR